jgi:ubiquinone/menaquinone biosynthesis C-methylase UbiE/uncharacterized protein YbaR (Trm112 family)
MLTRADLAVLACPGCRGELRFDGSERAGLLDRGRLICSRCSGQWPVRDGLAKVYDETALSFKERLIRHSYDRYGRFHDPLVRLIFPLLEEETSDDNRRKYLARLELLSLTPRPDGRPTRILEIGVGSGDDIPAVRRHVPADLDLEVWGVDVSVGMLRVLRPKLGRPGYEKTRILMADAHALPFRDGAFDRVFHVGAANSYRDPPLAIREMTRVAAPGSPIVVVDEWLDESKPPRIRDRLLYRMLTPYDWRLPHPVGLVPTGATNVTMEQLNPVFYCLSFRSSL